MLNEVGWSQSQSIDASSVTRRLAKARWLLWGLTVLVALASVVLLYFNRETSVPASWGVEAGVRTPLALVDKLYRLGTSVAFTATIAALILGRQPGNRVAWMLCVLGMVNATESLVTEYTIYGLFTRPGSLPGGLIAGWFVNWLWTPSVLLIQLTSMVFPDGRLSSAWRPALWIWFIAGLGVLGLGALEEPMSSAFYLDNPLMPPDGGAWIQSLISVFYILFVLSIIATATSVVLRFRRARGQERQQFKWLAAAAILAALLFVSGFSWGIYIDNFALAGVLVNMALVNLPLAIGVAVLQYRLYDVDLIIRRTLVYGVLTASLALIYFATVAILQSIVTAVSGRSSPVVTVISTLAIAALFSPLRRRVQSFIDQRFYRSRYDAARTLAEFGATARDETDLDRLAGRLVGVVDETVRPNYLSLWLRPLVGDGRQSSAEQ